MADTDRTQDSVVIERLLDAPVDAVWRMWTEPEEFAAWYGPDGAMVDVTTFDVRVGGGRRIAMEMTTPGGTWRMWFTGEFREVEEPHRLVYTEAVADEEGNVVAPPGHPATTEVTVELEDRDGRTRLVLTHAGVAADSPGGAGWRMALDKLAARVGTD